MGYHPKYNWDTWWLLHHTTCHRSYCPRSYCPTALLENLFASRFLWLACIPDMSFSTTWARQCGRRDKPEQRSLSNLLKVNLGSGRKSLSIVPVGLPAVDPEEGVWEANHLSRVTDQNSILASHEWGLRFRSRKGLIRTSTRSGSPIQSMSGRICISIVKCRSYELVL